MQYQVLNDRLLQGGRTVPFVPTPNQGGRIEPALIVVHFTADHLHPEDSINWFKKPESGVSAHLVIGRDGAITQMVDFDRLAKHAGVSSWNGRSGCNGFSIGIEVDNPGHLAIRGKDGVAWFGTKFDRDEHGLVEHKSAKYGHYLWMPYTAAQMTALRGVIAALLAAYPSIVDIRGHDEISPGRKNDPGPLMDMAALRAMLGDRAPVPPVSVRSAQQRLVALGYDPGDVDGLMGPRTRTGIRAFQEQNGIATTGALDVATVEALHSDAAKPMPTGTRETAPAPVSKADMVTARGAEATATYTVVDAAASPSVPADPLVALESADKVIGHAEKGRAVIDRSSGILDWLIIYLQTPAGQRVAITLVLCVGVWLYANRDAVRARLGRLARRLPRRQPVVRPA